MIIYQKKIKAYENIRLMKTYMHKNIIRNSDTKQKFRVYTNGNKDNSKMCPIGAKCHCNVATPV